MNYGLRRQVMGFLAHAPVTEENMVSGEQKSATSQRLNKLAYAVKNADAERLEKLLKGMLLKEVINNPIVMKVLGSKARLWWEVAEKELGDEKYCVGTLLDMAMLLQKNCAEMGNDSKAVEFGKMIGILRSNGAFTEDEMDEQGESVTPNDLGRSDIEERQIALADAVRYADAGRLETLLKCAMFKDMINNWIMMKVLGPKARLWWEVAEKELGDEKYCVGTLLDMAMLLQKNCAEMGNDSKAVEFGKMIGILRSNGAFTEDERTRFRVEDFPDPFVNSGGIRLKLQPDKHDIDRNPALYDQVCDDSDFFKNFYEPEKNKNEVY